MASTRNFPCSADTLVAQSGSSEMGAGKDDHLPIGLWGSYLFRSYLKFTPDWSGMTKIVSAQLHLRTSNQYHIGFGSSPRVIIDAVASSGGNFVENSSVGSCNGGSWGTGSTNWGNQPAVTAADRVSPAITTTESAWVSLDLTEMVKYWAPAAAGGGAGPNYGLRIRSYDETSQSRTTEFYSREQGTNDPYISVTYESNNAPATPTTTAPVGALPAGTNPTFVFSSSDPDVGDVLAKYDLQVSQYDDGWESSIWNDVGDAAGISGWSVSRAYAGPALTPGTTYYWRVKVYDQSGGASGWSAIKSFSISAGPVVSGADLPYGGLDHVAPVWNLADAVDPLVPKPEFKFTLRDPAGNQITQYELQVGALAVETVTGPWPSGTVITHQSSQTVANGVASTVRIRETTTVEVGAWSAAVNFKMWFSRAVLERNIAAGTGVVVTPSGMAVGARYAFIYRSATGAAGAGAGAWSTSPVNGNPYINVMVRMTSFGTAPVQPTMPSLALTYNTTGVLRPLSWQFPTPTDWELDTGRRLYGINSLKYDADASVGSAATEIYQDVVISAKSDYTFSIWLNAEELSPGDVTCQLFLYPAGTSTGTPLAVSDLLDVGAQGGAATAILGWYRLIGTVTRAQLGSASSVRFVVRMPFTRRGKVWFDGAMLSEGLVTQSWTAALSGPPVVIDAAGVTVDATLGGFLRLLGSGGGTRDIVETGVNGLKFGGDTELSSPIPGHVGYFAGPNIAAELVAGGVELTQPTPYIDFKDTLADDFDARLWMPTPGTMEFNAPGGVRANGAPISKGWVFVPIATQVLRSGVTNPGSAGAAITEEATGVPANVAVALALTIGVRDSAGSNVAISAVNWDGTTAFQNFSSGVAGRGGFALASPVLCGGLNGRQFKWAGSVTGVATTYYVYVNGYWMVG